MLLKNGMLLMKITDINQCDGFSDAIESLLIAFASK